MAVFKDNQATLDVYAIMTSEQVGRVDATQSVSNVGSVFLINFHFLLRYRHDLPHAGFGFGHRLDYFSEMFVADRNLGQEYFALKV